MGIPRSPSGPRPLLYRLNHQPAHCAQATPRRIAMIDALYEINDFKHPKYGLQAFVLLYTFHHLIRIQQRRYGAYLYKKQVADLIAPHLVTLKLVSSWLAHHGVPFPSTSTTHVGGWLTIYRLPMTKANTTPWYNVPTLPQQRRTRPSFARFATLPAALTVAPTTYFSSPRPRAASRQTSKLVSNGPMHRNSDLELQNASAAFTLDADALVLLAARTRAATVTPTCLRLLYKTLTYVPRASSKNKLGVAGYL